MESEHRQRKEIDSQSARGEVQWLPPRVDFPLPKGVPEQVGEASVEAHRSLSVGNLRAAVLMARSVFEAVSKDHGAEGKSLYAKIENMQTQGHLTSSITQFAHAIREWGNAMAHGDFSEPVERVDAELLLSLMDAVLRALYSDHETLRRLQERQGETG